MRLDYNLNLSQQQKLVMTQNMQLSISILQMSSLELSDYINKQLEENPILETETKDNSDINNIEYKDIIRENVYDKGSYTQGEGTEDSISPLEFISEKKSLKNFLKEQLNCSKKIEDIRSIVEFMIESLDERGYLQEDSESICRNFNVEEEIYEKALNFLQSLEPVGIGARNLSECLILQLRKMDKLDKYIEKIILEYLELVADNSFRKIAKILDITDIEAQNYGDIIKSLEPKPSRGFYTGEEVKFITPDAYIRKLDGEYIVIMNNEVIPQLTVNNIYRNLILHGNDKEAEEYVKEKINNAMFLIKSINSRENTLKKILEVIIKRQKKYFDKGKKYLMPMTLKDIAEDVKVHESTVSRAIKEKYILTSYGTIKIKDIFTNGIINKNEKSQDVSVKGIKDIIKEIIEGENTKKPLSDELISVELSKKNLNISRRTVAKYREEMGIKSSSKRKRL